MTKETMQIIFGLIGGLAIFIYGMNLMSECLQKAAGEKMKTILGMLTRNPVMGVLAGALTTAVLQSSSATTVMAIGFVSANLMTLPQAISIILGANIGTTMTAQLLAFKISDYIYLIIFAGFIVNFISKNEKVKAIGQTVFAFGLLFEGIEIMGSVMKPLATSQIFLDLLGKVTTVPILGVLLGTCMTLVVQSSSATIAVLQNFASQAGPDGVTSIIGLAGAIPVLLGDNIGTTITALLASIGQSKDARRTALAHCTFNISGCALFIWFVKPYAWLIQQISTKGPEIEVISRQIANAHTFFNISMTVIWIPFIWLLVKIVTFLVPDGVVLPDNSMQPKFLDRNLIAQPAAALHMATKEILHCSDLVKEVLQTTSEAIKLGAVELPAGLTEKAAAVHNLFNAITEYMSELYAAGVLTEDQAEQTAGLLYTLSDIDQLGLLCNGMAKDIAAHRTSKDEKENYSDAAMMQLGISLDKITEMFSNAMKVLVDKNADEAQMIRLGREEILDLDIAIRKSHVKRVKNGECSASLTAPFGDILHAIDRMSNSCVNIADAALGEMDFGYFLQDELMEAR